MNASHEGTRKNVNQNERLLITHGRNDMLILRTAFFFLYSTEKKYQTKTCDFLKKQKMFYKLCEGV